MANRSATAAATEASARNRKQRAQEAAAMKKERASRPPCGTCGAPSVGSVEGDPFCGLHLREAVIGPPLASGAGVPA